ncbi:MAG TPA: YcjF family protein [Xanthobacteraceae bacterium]|jgi:uncharacterized protein (DUF697 family)|nr:YcjF family protein [Xanthobacteraceae bacterium]
MSRKPLPKAIRQTLTPFRDTALVLDEEAPAKPPRVERTAAKTETEAALAVSSAPIANDAAPSPQQQASPEDRAFAEKRRARALKIVDRHRNLAAVGGLVPLPVANIASVTAVNLRMVKQLSDLYQVPFERDRTRSLIVSLVGGAVPTGLGTATSTTLMWIVPGGLVYGMGVAAIAAAAITRGIGLVFVDSFETGATLGTTPGATA